MAIESGTIVRFGFGGVFLLVGLVVLRAAAGRLRKAWLLLSTGQSNVADLQSGEVGAVTGTAVPLTEDRVTAPLLDETGLLVGTTIQAYDRNAGENGTGDWDTFHDSIDSVPFAVADDTGRVDVAAPDASDFSGDVDFTGSVSLDRGSITSGAGQAPPAGIEAYADAHSTERAVPDPDANRRYRQGVLAEGDEVYVLGEVRSDSSGLTLSGPADTTAFTLSTDGKPSALTQVFFAAFIGVFGVAATAAGAALLALPYL